MSDVQDYPMPETISQPSATIDLTPTAALLQNGSPRGMYCYFLLAICRNVFEKMSTGSDDEIYRTVGSLIAFIPSPRARAELLETYNKTRTGGTSINAAIATVGQAITYLNDLLEFSEDSTGGLL